jgi:hypothetical protein
MSLIYCIERNGEQIILQISHPPHQAIAMSAAEARRIAGQLIAEADDWDRETGSPREDNSPSQL